jgi:hypothetical protein
MQLNGIEEVPEAATCVGLCRNWTTRYLQGAVLQFDTINVIGQGLQLQLWQPCELRKSCCGRADPVLRHKRCLWLRLHSSRTVNPLVWKESCNCIRRFRCMPGSKHANHARVYIRAVRVWGLKMNTGMKTATFAKSGVSLRCYKTRNASVVRVACWK